MVVTKFYFHKEDLLDIVLICFVLEVGWRAKILATMGSVSTSGRKNNSPCAGVSCFYIMLFSDFAPRPYIAISMCLRMAVRVMMPMISILPLKV